MEIRDIKEARAHQRATNRWSKVVDMSGESNNGSSKKDWRWRKILGEEDDEDEKEK